MNSIFVELGSSHTLDLQGAPGAIGTYGQQFLQYHTQTAADIIIQWAPTDYSTQQMVPTL